jgi:hypothetical protein
MLGLHTADARAPLSGKLGLEPTTAWSLSPVLKANDGAI